MDRKKLIEDLDYVASWPMELLQNADASTQSGINDYKRSYEAEINKRYGERFGEPNEDLFEIIRSRLRRNQGGQGPEQRIQRYNQLGTPSPQGGQEIASLMEVLKNLS